VAIVREDEIFPRLRRQPGGYTSREVTLPAEATYLTVIADSRALWDPRGAREIVLGLEVQAFVDGIWIVLGGFTTDASDVLNQVGAVTDASSVRVRLPRTRAGTPPVRTVLQCASACTGAVRLVFDDVPPPVRPLQEHHSVTYDADGEASGTAVASVTIGAFTVANNANRCLMVGWGGWDDNGGDLTLSSITHNSSTAGWSQVHLRSAGSGDRAAIHRKIAPSAASSTVVVTMVGTCQSLGAHALSVWDVDQTTPTAGATGSDVTGGALTVNVSAATNDMVYDVVYCYGDGNFTYAPGASQTERADILVTDYTGDTTRLAASTEPGATTVTMSWSAAVGELISGAQAACAIKVVAAAAGHPAMRRLGSIGYGPRQVSRGRGGVH